MGLSPFHPSDCKTDTPTSPTERKPLPNPNKHRWSLESLAQCPNGWCVAVIRYHDCVNYEGRKVLVYDDGEKFSALLRSGIIDPHFTDDSYSPVARFEPTERGITLARKVAERGGG